MPAPRTAHVLQPADRPPEALPASHGWVRILADGRVGSRNLLQREFRFGPGRTPELTNDGRDEVMYVVEGIGTIDLGGASYELAPGTGAFVPPGVSYEVENAGPHDLVMVSVISPPPGSDPIPDAGSASSTRPDAADSDDATESHSYTVREEDRPELPAGEDRRFKVLIDPRNGCRTMTQFIGSIDRGHAPPHRHDFEEAVYILEGDGLAHVDGATFPLAPGTAVFLPPASDHTLENTTRESLKLLGVISPAGSPARMRASEPT